MTHTSARHLRGGEGTAVGRQGRPTPAEAGQELVTTAADYLRYALERPTILPARKKMTWISVKRPSP